MKRFAILVLGLSLSAAAAAQSFPAKPVKLIVPFPPGGGTDVLARLIAQELGRLWSQSVVVENRAGAGGIIGTDAAAKAAPDGHTLLQATMAATAVAPTLYAKVPYDPERDFAYVAPIGKQASVLLANAKLPVASFRELVDHARTNKLTYAGPGVGLSGHLGMELILQRAGISALHVPYKGSAPASQAMVAGETDLTLDLVSTGQAYVRSGKARPLGVTSEARASQLPEVPTFGEMGYPGVLVETWQGIAAPAGTPRELVARIAQDMRTIKALPEFRERLARMGIEPFDAPPEAFAAFVRDESKRWGDLVKRLGVKLD